jgi:predicted PurR-regulated permease PerM
MTKPLPLRQSSVIQTLAILIGVLATLYFAKDVLIPLAFAVTFTLILTPIVVRLVKMRIPRAFAAIVVVAVSIVAAVGIGVVLVNQLIQVLNELPQYQENIHAKIQAMRAPSKGAVARATENVRELGHELSTAQTPVTAPPQSSAPGRKTSSDADRPLPVHVVAEPANELEYLRDLTRPFLRPLGMLGIVLILTVFLLIEQDDLRDRLFRLAGLSRMNQVTQALNDATRRVSRYLLLQFLVNAIFGTLCGLGLFLIGVPYAVLWGAVAAILRIVPYVGAAIAGLLPLLLSLAVFDSWKPPLFVFLMFASLELLTANFLEPWLYGTHTGISSLALLLTTVFWAILWGPAGLILSTPLTVCLVVLGRHVPQFSFLHVLLGDEPTLEASAQVYHRLLTMDDFGARSVLDQNLRDTSVAKLYDSVLIPTLTMVERDRHKGALDPDREEFIFMSIREMMSEFLQRIPMPEGANDKAAGTIRGTRFLCVPANDESDEIAAGMLAQLLAAEGHLAVVLGNDAGLPRSIRMIAPTENDVLCISALPPFAFTQARRLNIMLRRRFPKIRIIIGIWGFTGDANRAIQRFQPAGPDQFVTSLASAVEWMVGDKSVDGISSAVGSAF